MKYEKRVIDEQKKILRITTSDERWYEIDGIYVPSVTWIAEFYPKGIGFYKWLANTGWNEAESIRNAAGDKGSKVHQAITELIKGQTIRINSKYFNETINDNEELTPEEYNCLMSFTQWCKNTKPTFLKQDFVVHNKEENYAGTVDCLAKISDQTYLIDFKTSANIWPSHLLQVSAYRAALHPDEQIKTKMAILQLGYARNKLQYKVTQIEDKYNLFLAAKTIWANETKNIVPLQRDYPLELKLESEVEK